MKLLQRVREGFTFAGDTNLIAMTCPTCGVSYAMPHTMQKNAYDKGHRAIVWYCPNGHELGYNGESEDEKKARLATERARRAEERAMAERDLRVDTEHRLRAQKGATTKARKRAAASMCPVDGCRRTVDTVAMQNHIASEHPDFKP